LKEYSQQKHIKPWQERYPNEFKPYLFIKNIVVYCIGVTYNRKYDNQDDYNFIEIFFKAGK